MPPLELNDLKTTLEEYKGKIEQGVATVVKESGDKAQAAVNALKDELKAVTDALANIKGQMALAAAKHIPGLREEAKKFDFGCAIGGMYAESLRAKGAFNGDPWKGRETEKEMLDAMQAVRKDAQAGDGTLGGYLISDEVSREVVDLAIADMPVMELGPMVIRGLVGDLPIPKLTSRPNAYWVGENTAPTKSDAAYGIVTLRPKKVGAYTIQSNRLIYQSRGVSDQVIRKALAEAMALKMEEGLISGLGSESQPRGVMNHSGMTTSSVAMSASVTRFRIDHASSMLKDLDVANEFKGGVGKFGFLMRPEVKWGMKRERSVQFSGQAEAQGMPVLGYAPLLTDKALEDLLGVKIRTSTLLSATESHHGSSTTSSVIAANWDMLRVGFWRDFVLKVSDQASDGSTSALLTDSVFIVCFQEVDCAIARATAFTKAVGAETAEASWA